MRKENVYFTEMWRNMRKRTVARDAIEAFVSFMENRFGARFVYDASSIPFQRPELFDLFERAASMRTSGVMGELRLISTMPDEPRLSAWSAEITGKHSDFASGASLGDDRAGLSAALAEALERHLWKERVDHLSPQRVATVGEIARAGAYLAPERVAGFSDAQRKKNELLQYREDSVFSWTRGYSWTAKRPLWIPAQLASGSAVLYKEARKRHEPILLSNSTNGLATAPSQKGALLAGALELIERDAYMIMWLNQLTLPQFDLDDLRLRGSSLSRLLMTCKRYRLRVHAIRLITDAPSYAVCVVVADETPYAPHITLGLRADRNPARAVEKALLEALRMRHVARRMIVSPPKNWRRNTKARDVDHMDRLLYWAEGDRSQKLSFLTGGEIKRHAEPWEHDTDDEHFERILDWCRQKNYECASVSLTRSAANPTPWHVEMVLIPELQPIHLTERLPHVGGKRLQEIPRSFGYASKEHPFADDPHPFA